MGGVPAQFRLRARRIGLHRCDIACTARACTVGIGWPQARSKARTMSITL